MTTITRHTESVTSNNVAAPGEPHTGSRIWAVVRMAIGWTFLWAFLDKTFALGFATGRLEDGTIDYLGDAAWLSGGSPTNGYLSFATRGPLAGAFDWMAGAVWADWLFMIGLLGIGLALVLGIGMRLAAMTGAALLVFMWAAALWPENNPFMDDHLIYAGVLFGLVVVNAGDTWGLGRWWKDRELVQRYPVLR